MKTLNYRFTIIKHDDGRTQVALWVDKELVDSETVDSRKAAVNFLNEVFAEVKSLVLAN